MTTIVNSMDGTFQIDVKCCARCGGDHDQLRFMVLGGHERYTHWAICPVSTQPILLRFDLDPPPEGE
jgi:hypothetical protein